MKTETQQKQKRKRENLVRHSYRTCQYVLLFENFDIRFCPSKPAWTETDTTSSLFCQGSFSCSWRCSPPWACWLTCPRAAAWRRWWRWTWRRGLAWVTLSTSAWWSAFSAPFLWWCIPSFTSPSPRCWPAVRTCWLLWKWEWGWMNTAI